MLLILTMLAASVLLLSSCFEKSDLEFELSSDGASYTCLGFKEGKSAAEVVIPDTYKNKPVTAIAANAFNENPMLDIYANFYSGKEEEEKTPITSVSIPASVTKIGNAAFSDCYDLKTYNLPANLEMIGAQAFLRSGITGEVKIPETVTTIGESAFSATAITSATIPASVTEIPASLFAGCDQLTSVTMADAVTVIGAGAFSGCEALTTFTFPASLTTIGDKAFASCVALREITIPTTVTTLGYQVFNDTHEELVVNVSYDNERPEGWDEHWYGGMAGKAFNNSEAYYNNVVVAEQAKAETLMKQLESYENQYKSYTEQMESKAAEMKSLQANNGINPSDYVLDKIYDMQKEINNLNRSRAEVGGKITETKEALKAYKITNQLN